MNTYRILYRGSLSSCNYSCGYCPFAKTRNSREELRTDALQLQRFVEWVESTRQSIGVLFTPWGEAITHAYYRRAIVDLSQLSNVHRVAIQTNLSGPLDDFAMGDADTIAFWATYHPDQVKMGRFIDKCNAVAAMGISFSVGVVGLHEHFESIAAVRSKLPSNVYVWINSYKREPDYYSDQDLRFLSSIDPYFDLNRHQYASLGRPCSAGDTSFTVDGEGVVRRCHFIDTPIGNLYRGDILNELNASSCTNATCGCHIGYVHRPELELQELFGANLLERIPATWPKINAKFAPMPRAPMPRAPSSQKR